MQKLIFMLCFVPRESNTEVEVSEEVFRAAFNIPDVHFSPNGRFANGIVQGRVDVAKTPEPEIEWFEDSPSTIAHLYNERVITDMNIIFTDPDGERTLFAGSDDKGNNYLLMSLSQRIGILKLTPKENRRSNLTVLHARFQVEKSYPISHSFLSRKHFLNENERINFDNLSTNAEMKASSLAGHDTTNQQVQNGSISESGEQNIFLFEDTPQSVSEIAKKFKITSSSALVSNPNNGRLLILGSDKQDNKYLMLGDQGKITVIKLKRSVSKQISFLSSLLSQHEQNLLGRSGYFNPTETGFPKSPFGGFSFRQQEGCVLGKNTNAPFYPNMDFSQKQQSNQFSTNPAFTVNPEWAFQMTGPGKLVSFNSMNEKLVGEIINFDHRAALIGPVKQKARAKILKQYPGTVFIENKVTELLSNITPLEG